MDATHCSIGSDPLCVSACASIGILCILWTCLHHVTAVHVVGGAGCYVEQVHSDNIVFFVMLWLYFCARVCLKIVLN